MKKSNKEKVNKFVKGSISVLLSCLLTGVLSVGALLVEGSRYQDARKQLEEASLNSALSILASYSSDLQSRFGLYGIDSESVSADQFLNYLMFNSDSTESGVYSANNISQLYSVTSGTYELKYDLANYPVLKRQILEYEKYRAPLNVATDLLDIDKMIKELKENIAKAIPGLENFLKICEAVSDLAEGIKNLYCLYKDVQQLQLMINKGGEEDLGEAINNKLGQGWQWVEGLFSDEEWPPYDPSYIEAYEDFKTAVNDKVQYMKDHPSAKSDDKKVVELNDAINEKKGILITVITDISKELGNYGSSLTNVASAASSASTAIKDIHKVATNDKTEDVNKGANTFDTIAAQLLDIEASKPENGVEFLNKQKEKLTNLSANDITSSYNFDSEFNTGDLLHDSAYYMSKTQVSGFCLTLAGVQIVEVLDNLYTVLKSMWDILQVFKTWPDMFELDCIVTLKDPTTSILPSKINGGAGTNEAPNTDDISAISSILDEAKNLLNGEHTSAINSVEPSSRVAESELTAEISDRINRLGENITSIMSSNILMTFLTAIPIFLVALVFHIISLIPKLIQVIEDIIFLIEHFEESLKAILNSLGESLLINQYIVEKFPNRLTDTDGNKLNNEIGGWNGEKRTIYPSLSNKMQTFSGAQVEYVVAGHSSEILNQTQCFWSIFLIRAINNIVGVALSDAMEIIAACNIAAPLVFILWVYLETNIDMNLLLLDKEVPLIKTSILLSQAGLTNYADALTEAMGKLAEKDIAEKDMTTAVSQAVVDAIPDSMEGPIPFKMKYKDYLWFYLFMTPNKTKVLRAADLIQMEIRYKQSLSGQTTFLLQNVHTYVRSEAEGDFNSILPVISLGNNSLNGRGFKVRCTKYVGY